MSVDQLMADLSRLGIKIEANGGRLRYSPRSAVTQDIMARLKAHKDELLAILRPDPEGKPLGPDGWPVDSIEPPSPCPSCGRLELWESAAGDLCGLRPGLWRCLMCDPPEAARRLRERAVRLKPSR
jgi:hypothetical protein